MKTLSRIQAAVREGRYEVTDHAKGEAESDDLAPSDVRNAMLQGRLVRRYAHDPRGTRYKIYGPALDGRMMYVVCRFDELDQVVVLTCYAEVENG